MLLKLKQIGDVCTLDDINAIVYLLKQNHKPVETIELSQETFNGDFGSYTLIYDDEELLTVRNEGYTFEDITKSLTLMISNSFKDAIYNLTVTAETYVGEGVEIEDSIIEHENIIRTVNYQSERLSDDLSQIIIPLSDFISSSEETIGEIIKINAIITLEFYPYFIDKKTGSLLYDTDVDLIEDETVLINAITNAPTGRKTTLYLSPGLTFELSDTIEIKNKTIELISGSVPSTLDANNNCRHFFVDYDGKLILKNINLTNGYDLSDETNVGGGSIFVNSVIDSFNYIQGSLECIDCNFNNNRSNTHGGAIYSNDALVTIEDCVFLNNIAKSTSDVWGNGGAIYQNNLTGD